MKVKRFILPSILACLLFFITSAVFNNSVTTVYYDFQSDKTYGSSEIKIVHISDTHSTIYPNNQLAEKIKEQNPDIILMTGDIAEDIMPFEGTEILLKQIKDIAPIYYVTGNHEYAAADFEEANEKIQSYGVHYLDDDYQIITIQGNKILVAGVNDPLSKKVKQPYIKMPERLETLSEQYKKTGFKGLKILLSHRPELHEMYAAQDYDFVLSGHAHGGQARIPYLLNGLVAPNQGYFPKYAGGVYALPNDSNTKLIVSRGLSLDALPRIFNPPELVVITITGTR